MELETFMEAKVDTSFLEDILTICKKMYGTLVI